MKISWINEKVVCGERWTIFNEWVKINKFSFFYEKEFLIVNL